jgi:hypothetical protein
MRGVGSLATVRIWYRTVVLDVCLFFYGPVVLFPVCKAQLIGDWYENRRSAPNTIIFLIIHQYYWRTDAPCANRSGGPNTKKQLLANNGQHCLLAERDIGAPIYWRTDVPRATTIGAPNTTNGQNC